MADETPRQASLTAASEAMKRAYFNSPEAQVKAQVAQTMAILELADAVRSLGSRSNS